MNRRAVGVGVAVAAVAALGVWLSRPGGPHEPVHRGKTLGAWLDDRRAMPRGPDVLSDEAVAAVRALGPKAIPTLLAWLRSSDSPVSRRANWVLEWRLKLPLRVPTNEENWTRAMQGFWALGPAARSAFPELVEFAFKTPDRWQAINALLESDADAIRLVASSLQSPDREVRLRAIDILTSLRMFPDEVSLPALEGALDDPDRQVRAEAAKAIAFYDQSLGFSVNWLTLADAELRFWGAKNIGRYRTHAQAFLPNLEAAADDDDPKVREAVAEAIQQVRGRESPPTN
jgi:HEAT repeats/HEAT repeat